MSVPERPPSPPEPSLKARKLAHKSRNEMIEKSVGMSPPVPQDIEEEEEEDDADDKDEDACMRCDDAVMARRTRGGSAWRLDKSSASQGMLSSSAESGTLSNTRIIPTSRSKSPAKPVLATSPRSEAACV
mgnify:CR=1 FL=1